VLASSLLMIAKHGNRASTSKSGSADLLQATSNPPNLDIINPSTLATLYQKTNYAFLFAPVFHPGMRYVAPIRKELGWRTIFNLLGPLSNPADSHGDAAGGIEARLIGVARKDLGPAFAEALRQSGANKALVVCGDEDLDELSCAGVTHCWWVRSRPTTTTTTTGSNGSGSSKSTEYFTLTPHDFGLAVHPLSAVSPGQEPAENAAIFERILAGKLAADDPLIEFVLVNTAALLVVSGICEADSSAMGAGDDGLVVKERGPGGGRWKEGVRRARWAISSGAAREEWGCFCYWSNYLGK
jgi:anthranilate phosphoribosyltransferase